MSRVQSLLTLALPGCGVPGLQVELSDGTAPVRVGPADLRRRAATEFWDRDGTRRGRVVACDVEDAAHEPLTEEAAAHLTSLAALVGDLAGLEDLERTQQELQAAVSMTQHAEQQREQRDDRIRRHLVQTLSGQVLTLRAALSEIASAGSSRGGDLSGAARRASALARAASIARSIGWALDDLTLLREGLSEAQPAPQRLEDLVDAALRDLGEDPDDVPAGTDLRVVGIRDARLLVDPEAVRSALRHLLSDIVLQTPDHVATRVEIDAEPREGLCIVTVEDDAGAARPRHLRRLLAAGVGGTGEGDTGLGMAVVRTVVEAHGGRCWVEDSDMGGARVCLTLPVAALDDLEARRRAEDGTTPGATLRHPSDPARRIVEEPEQSSSAGSGSADDAAGPADPAHGAAEQHDVEETPDNVRPLFDRG